jgi:hypothetical protein
MVSVAPTLVNLGCATRRGMGEAMAQDEDGDGIVDYDEAIRMMVRGLHAYMPWLHDLAYGVYDHESKQWDIEPIEAAFKEYKVLEQLLKDLEECQLTPEQVKLMNMVAKGHG